MRQIKTDGIVKDVPVPEGETVYTVIRGLINDGFVELIKFKDGSALAVDEEGRPKDLLNARASCFCYQQGFDLWIVGDAVLLSREEVAQL